MIKWSYIFFTIISSIFLACVETIDFQFETTQGLMVIDAVLDDSEKDQFISIKKSLDAYSSGTEIKNRLITKIPLNTSYGFLIEISQKNIDSKAYRYLKILIEQNQTNGSLADSPPAALIGNIKSITNPKEIVGGYFMVGNTSVYRLWVSRQDAGIYNPVGLLGGRAVNYEPSTLTRPPLANCINSRTRTPLKPEGWPNY